MRPWQLYIDESGNFDDPNEPVLVAGVLFAGRALPQVSQALRSRISEVFVGSAYPPHAAHHNVASSLLCETLAGRAAEGPAAARFLRAIEGALPIAQRGTSREARELREAVAAVEGRLRVRLAPLSTFDAWLKRASPEAHQALVAERDAQLLDLARFVTDRSPAGLGSSPVVVAAWQRGRDTAGTADARYEVLYETLLERALAFATSRDEGAEVQVHLGARARHPAPRHIGALNHAESGACSFPLLRLAKSASRIIRFSAETYGRWVAPGIVLADFASNRLRSALLGTPSWGQVKGSFEDRLGLAVEGNCALLPLAAALPAVAADGPVRDAIRAAAEGRAPLPLSGPAWAREQAAAWIAALSVERAP